MTKRDRNEILGAVVGMLVFVVICAAAGWVAV